MRFPLLALIRVELPERGTSNTSGTYRFRGKVNKTINGFTKLSKQMLNWAERKLELRSRQKSGNFSMPLTSVELQSCSVQTKAFVKK